MKAGQRSCILSLAIGPAVFTPRCDRFGAELLHQLLIKFVAVVGTGPFWLAASFLPAGLTGGIRAVTVSLAPSNRFFRLYRP